MENYKGVAVKVLLDSRAIGLFMDTKFAKKKGFKLEKLKKPLLVQNIDSMVNIGGAITHQVKCNMFFKGHVERIKINVYNLGKTEVILGILQLAAHNLEIDWEKREVKITRCLPICGRKKKKEKKVVRKIEEEKTVEELVPRRFWKWKKVFGKAKSERIPVQKTWNYAIELKEGFVPKKEKVCSLSREE